MRVLSGMNTCLLLLSLAQAVPRPGVGSPVDEGVLVVRVDTMEVARESFRLSQGRLSRGGEGWTLATTIRYDRARPVVVLSPILEVSSDTQPATLQYDVADPRQPARILGELGRGRFTVRFVARATERDRFGRNGIYDVTVTRADGAVVAEFRGQSRQTKDQT